MAGALRQLGLRREERILLLMQDTADWPVVFLGALHAGVVPVAVNTLLTADDAAANLPALGELLHACVQGGASVNPAGAGRRQAGAVGGASGRPHRRLGAIG
ncbi:hypothetical protein G6F32_016252 [Rhizopus arrhizus]|nr:hypothetical protein G6F32_016252 [Rhizopus arrhizus]